MRPHCWIINFVPFSKLHVSHSSALISIPTLTESIYSSLIPWVSCLKLCYLSLTFVNVFPMYLQVVVPIRSALFVPKANGVTELMCHDVFVFTAMTNGKPGFSSWNLTNLTPTTVKSEKSSWAIRFCLIKKFSLNMDNWKDSIYVVSYIESPQSFHVKYIKNGVNSCQLWRHIAWPFRTTFVQGVSQRLW